MVLHFQYDVLVVNNPGLFCLTDRQELIYKKRDAKNRMNERFCPLKRYFKRVLQLVSENIPHTYTHTRTARIEYERTAAAVGSIPAVVH